MLVGYPENINSIHHLASVKLNFVKKTDTCYIIVR